VDHDSHKQADSRTPRGHRLSNESVESDEEIQLRMLAKRSSRSPVATTTSRSISYSATVTASYTLTDDIHEDRENWVDSAAPKTPASRKSASGTISVSKVRSSPRRVTDSNKSESRGVRKPSGRIGSTSSPSRATRAAA
jgi:cell division cycle 14